MQEPIVGVVTFLAKPGKTEEVGKLLTAVVEPTRAEEGVLYYDLYQDPAEPRRWVFVESWVSEEAIEKHKATAHLVALFEKLPALVEHSELNFLTKVC